MEVYIVINIDNEIDKVFISLESAKKHARDLAEDFFEQEVYGNEDYEGDFEIEYFDEKEVEFLDYNNRIEVDAYAETICYIETYEVN